MRKISNEQRLFLKKRQHRLARQQQRAANLRRQRKHAFSVFRKKHEEYYILKGKREQFRRQLYYRSYSAAPVTVDISGEFGIENSAVVDDFLDRSSVIIDFNNTELTIDLTNCTRMWPSAITLLCSLMQWVELSAPESRRPRLSSIHSNNDKVNSYLDHCGFYEYVHAKSPRDIKADYYSDKEIVKIQRETKASNIEPREDKIVALLERFSIFDAKQIELFNCGSSPCRVHENMLKMS